MSDHTPGPWSARSLSEDGGYSIEPTSIPNRGVVICVRAPWRHRAAESIANARLIAAAPELLIVAKEAIRHDEGGHIPFDRIERARAAIARAEGND